MRAVMIIMIVFLQCHANGQSAYYHSDPGYIKTVKFNNKTFTNPFDSNHKWAFNDRFTITNTVAEHNFSGQPYYTYPGKSGLAQFANTPYKVRIEDIGRDKNYSSPLWLLSGFLGVKH